MKSDVQINLEEHISCWLDQNQTDLYEYPRTKGFESYLAEIIINVLDVTKDTYNQGREDESK